MDDITKHIQNTLKRSRLLLANVLLEDMVKNCVWVDEYFEGQNVETIENYVSSYVSSYHGTTTIYGFSYGPNIDKIIESFSTTQLKNTTLTDLKHAKDYALVTRRIFRLSNVSGIHNYSARQQDGYCVVSGKKILAAEVGIEDHDSTDLLRQISSLKGEILQQKSKIVELESEIEISRSTLQDKEAALAGRANLTWS